MKYANKIGAAYSMILGDDEIAKGTAQLKNMETSEVSEIEIENIVDVMNKMLK